MDWLDEIEARGYTNDLTPNDVYLLLAEVRRLREVHSVDVNKMIATETEVDAAPTIDPARHARWKLRKVNDEHVQYICSGCNDYLGFKGRDIPDALTVRDSYKYCRYCGARMDGEGEKDG